MNSTSYQQHIRTFLSLPKNNEHIGGQHDDSFSPVSWFTPIWSGVRIHMYTPRGRRSTVRSQGDQVYPTPTKFGCAKYLLIGQTHKIRKWSKIGILRSPTWSELGKLDHPGSARSIFCPVGHTYGCRRQVPGIQMVVNHDTGQKESLYCPPIFSLFLGRLKKPRMCCWIGWFHQTNKNRLY